MTTGLELGEDDTDELTDGVGVTETVDEIDEAMLLLDGAIDNELELYGHAMATNVSKYTQVGRGTYMVGQFPRHQLFAV